MSNKKVSEFTKVTTSQPSDLFLINQAGTTSTIAMSTVNSTILNGLDSTTAVGKLSSNFIKKPDTANIGDVLTYSSTGTWVASGSQFTGTSNQLLSSNGYQKLPGGLIMQWGRVPDTGQTYNFPIPFTTQCLNMVAALTGDSWDGAGETRVCIVNLSSFRVRMGGTQDNNNQIAMWQAIGY